MQHFRKDKVCGQRGGSLWIVLWTIENGRRSLIKSALWIMWTMFISYIAKDCIFVVFTQRML